MQSTKTHDIIFSEDMREHTFITLQSLLHKIHEATVSEGIFLSPDHARTILLLDANSQRAYTLATFFSSVGYRPFIVGSTLEAFTTFLQGSFTPFVIVLGLYDPNTHLFLKRLQQQIMRIHRWETPLIYLRVEEHRVESQGTITLPPPQTPAPLGAHPKDRERHASLVPNTDPLPYFPPILEEAFSHKNDEQYLPSARRSTLPLKQPLPSMHDIKPIINVSTFDTQVNQQQIKRISLEELSIGRYYMQTLLGEGPTGQVYLTYDRLRERDVALKAIQMNSLTAEMSSVITAETNFFEQEIDMLSSLEHPNILSPLNFGRSYISGSPFIFKTMTYYPEGSLATLMHRMNKKHLLPQREVITIIVQIADALQHAHTHNILYQNFKLSNFLIRNWTKSEQITHIMLSDFWATASGAPLLKTPDVFPYLAPECWSENAQPASDQYGLAAIAYELLTGHTPFQANSEHIMQQLHTAMPPQALTFYSPNISVSLSNVVLRALSKRPEERFPTIQHFADALHKKSM